MKVEILREELDQRFIVLERDGGDLVVKALFPNCARLTEELRRELREHKQDLLERLQFEEEADHLLLESTRRLAAAWPEDCDLERHPAWGALGQELLEAYQVSDRSRLADVLSRREAFAAELFRRGAE